MSTLGRQLDYAELFANAKGDDGTIQPVRKVDRDAIGYTVMPVKPTRTHALSNPTADQESQLLREGEANRKLASLTSDERRALLLHSRRHVEIKQVDVPAADAAELLEAGWFLVRQENGIATMSGEFAVEWTQDEIADLLGVNQSTVSRWLRDAHRKLR